ncbi:MAG: bifunctional 3-hydroxydecanoyl-ACP dehydratase/trans-2-decenoyl-ACP isomerase [Pseudomonadota bacterium]
MYRKNSFTKEDILKCGDGKLEGIEYPRLPLPNMLMVDSITKISDEGGRYGQGEVAADFEINPDSWFFDCHFKDDPVMPGSLALDGLCQLLGFYLGWKGHQGKGRAFGVGEVRYKGEILRTAGKISYQLDIKRNMNTPIPMSVADGKVLLHGQTIHTAKSLWVGVIPY